jgi:hypothetical protein
MRSEQNEPTPIAETGGGTLIPGTNRCIAKKAKGFCCLRTKLLDLFFAIFAALRETSFLVWQRGSQAQISPHVSLVKPVHLLNGLKDLSVICLGDFDHQFDHEISARFGLGIESTLSPQSEGLTALAPGRNLHVDHALDGWNGDGTARYRFVHCNGYVHVEGVPLSSQERMGCDVGDQIKIAGVAAIESRLSLPGHTDLRTFFHARGNCHSDAFSAWNHPVAAALGARLADLTMTVAVGAGSCETHGSLRHV